MFVSIDTTILDVLHCSCNTVHIWQSDQFTESIDGAWNSWNWAFTVRWISYSHVLFALSTNHFLFLFFTDVTKVKFSRPPNFKYLSGQWIRLNCTAFRTSEYHSFTLTSAPHENYLSCHVKAQGPWTWKLRNYFDPSNYNPGNAIPKVRLEGPFGGGNQDWYKHEIAIMVGGGIGVTPYASILNDLVFGTSTNRYSGVACKKV